MIYPPHEDSLLLQKWVAALARGAVLDMGTGSGIQAVTARESRRVRHVTAADLNPAVIAQCRRESRMRGITCVQSDLFSDIRGTFDTIIFNPPYLPQELPERDIALEGGKQGYETVVRFLERTNPFLETDGQILLLFSSLTNKKRVEDAITQQLFAFKELDRLHIFFEDLFVYQITKSPLLKRIEKAGVTGMTYLARGKRSWIFTGSYRGKKCVAKVKRPDSAAQSALNEGKNLALANKLRLGPKLFLAKKDFAVYAYVNGRHFQDALASASAAVRNKLFKQLFAQAFALDCAGLAKEEMLRPLKNALVTPSGRVVLIDFERMHRAKKPRNVTQLCTFAAKQGIAPLRTIQHWAAHYKRTPTRANFRALLEGMGL
jgi:release factor glutamine methyltransferase